MTQSHSSRTHAVCSPSSAHRWLNCPGSPGLIRIAPKRPVHPSAEEGTRAHELAEEMLKEWLANRHYFVVGPFDLSEEMAKHVKDYVAFVKSKAAEFDSKPAIKLETTLTLSADLLLKGTADVAMTGIKNGKAHGKVIDFKYGKTHVRAENNPQLAYYGAALLNESKRPLEEVEVSIFQPRAQGTSTVLYPIEALIKFEAVVKTAAERCYRQDLGLEEPQYVKGKWCEYCDAKPICPQYTTHEEGAGEEFL